MDIKCFAICSTLLMSLQVSASVPKLSIVTNRVYDPKCGYVCRVEHEYSRFSTITNSVLDDSEVKIITSMLDIYIRKVALKDYVKPKMQTDHRGRKFIKGFDFVRQFPVLLPKKINIYGLPYEDLELMIIPYVVENKHMKGCLRGAFCEYCLDGNFKFGLYVNINTFSVSPEFHQGSSCGMSVSGIGRYPYCNNVREQESFAKYIDGLTSSGSRRELISNRQCIREFVCKEGMSEELQISIEESTNVDGATLPMEADAKPSSLVDAFVSNQSNFVASGN